MSDDLKCSSCLNPLNVLKAGVMPCQTCCAEREQEGREKGYKEGYREGAQFEQAKAERAKAWAEKQRRER